MLETPNATVDKVLELLDELLGFPADMEHDELFLEIPSLLLKPTAFGDREFDGETLLAFVATPYSAVDLTVNIGPRVSLTHSVKRKRDGRERGYELAVRGITLDCPSAREFVWRLLDAYFPASLSITTR